MSSLSHHHCHLGLAPMFVVLKLPGDINFCSMLGCSCTFFRDNSTLAHPLKINRINVFKIVKIFHIWIATYHRSTPRDINFEPQSNVCASHYPSSGLGLLQDLLLGMPILYVGDPSLCNAAVLLH
jgi:hypothetical protein